jgi:uncharacterized membrane protein YGL010W
MLVFIYLLLCVVIGVVGRHRRPGFFGYFIFSLVLTPILMLLVLLFTQRRYLEREATIRSRTSVCRHCNAQRHEMNELRYCAHCGRSL